MTSPSTLWLRLHLPFPRYLPFGGEPKGGRQGKDWDRRGGKGIKSRIFLAPASRLGKPCFCLLKTKMGTPPCPPHLQCWAGTVRPRQVQCPGQLPAIAQVSASQHWPVPVGVQLSCEGDQTLLNSTRFPIMTNGAWGAQLGSLSERLCPGGSGSASSAVGQVITLPARTALWSPHD